MTVETAPVADLAVNLDEVKAFLRIEGADEDAFLAGLVRSATDIAEAFTGQRLVAREFSERVSAVPTWQRLSQTPVVAILAVESANTALSSSNYEVDIDAAGDGWVRIIACPDRRANVRYSAGLAAGWNGVPEPLRLGIIRLVSHLYTHRDAADAGGAPAAVAALWRPWRRVRI